MRSWIEDEQQIVAILRYAAHLAIESDGRLVGVLREDERTCVSRAREFESKSASSGICPICALAQRPR